MPAGIHPVHGAYPNEKKQTSQPPSYRCSCTSTYSPSDCAPTWTVLSSSLLGSARSHSISGRSRIIAASNRTICCINSVKPGVRIRPRSRMMSGTSEQAFRRKPAARKKPRGPCPVVHSAASFSCDRILPQGSLRSRRLPGDQKKRITSSGAFRGRGAGASAAFPTAITDMISSFSGMLSFSRIAPASRMPMIRVS